MRQEHTPIPLYHHRTDGGAEYLSDKFVLCPNGEKEGIFVGANFIVRLDGQPELIVSDLIAAAPELLEALENLVDARDLKMGPSAVKLRYEIARAAIARALGGRA